MNSNLTEYSFDEIAENFSSIYDVYNLVKKINNGELIISEVLSSNKNTVADAYGNTSDYIEIYNGYDYDINLGIDYIIPDIEYLVKNKKRIKGIF